jgi:RNA polymerase sigma-70 factor (ECF subfamily)
MNLANPIVRTNQQWLSDLKSIGSPRELALSDLRGILIGGLRVGLSGWANSIGPAFEALAEDFVQDALLKIIDHLDSFEGRSQFTTWAHKIAIRAALTELRRQHWKDASLDEMLEAEETGAAPAPMTDSAPNPEVMAERSNLMLQVQKMMLEELTDKQRQAMTLVAIKNIPLEEVARRMGTERNALYKLLHDARLKLKRRLMREGLSPQELMATFERE